LPPPVELELELLLPPPLELLEEDDELLLEEDDELLLEEEDELLLEDELLEPVPVQAARASANTQEPDSLNRFN